MRLSSQGLYLFLSKARVLNFTRRDTLSALSQGHSNLLSFCMPLLGPPSLHYAGNVPSHHIWGGGMSGAGKGCEESLGNPGGLQNMQPVSDGKELRQCCIVALKNRNF